MPYTAVTLAQLQTQLSAKVEGKPYWVPAEATLAINEALQLWGLLTGRWQRDVLVPTTAGNYDYALPAMLLYRTRVRFNGHPVSPSGREDLNNGRKNWRSETTASGGSVPTRVTLWAPVSLQLIYIWPADAVGGNVLTVSGVSATPVLISAGDFVDLGEEDLSVLLNFALHVLSVKKGGPWFTATLPLLVQFLQAAAAENSLITTSQTYRRFLGLTRQPPLRAANVSAEAVVKTAMQEIAQESS